MGGGGDVRVGRSMGSTGDVIRGAGKAATGVLLQSKRKKLHNWTGENRRKRKNLHTGYLVFRQAGLAGVPAGFGGCNKEKNGRMEVRRG